MSAYVSAEDIRRWELEERHDILAHVRANNVGWSDNGFANGFGSNINNCRMSCVYLEWEDSLSRCGIYETRTNVCRNYMPGSSDLCPQFHRKNPENT